MCIWFCPFLNMLHFAVTASSFIFHKISPTVLIIPVSCVCPVTASCFSCTCKNAGVVSRFWYIHSGSNDLWVSLILMTFAWFILNPWGAPWFYHRYWYVCQLETFIPSTFMRFITFRTHSLGIHGWKAILTLTMCGTSSSQSLCATLATNKKWGEQGGIYGFQVWLVQFCQNFLLSVFSFQNFHLSVSPLKPAKECSRKGWNSRMRKNSASITSQLA